MLENILGYNKLIVENQLLKQESQRYKILCQCLMNELDAVKLEVHFLKSKKKRYKYNNKLEAWEEI